MKRFRYFLLFGLLTISICACHDPKFDQLMNHYCDCISAARNQPDKRIECRKIMDSIKREYKNDPIKMGDVVERSGKCY